MNKTLGRSYEGRMGEMVTKREEGSGYVNGE